MKYALPGIIVLTFSFPVLNPILIGEAGAQTSVSKKIRKPVIVELFHIGVLLYLSTSGRTADKARGPTTG